MANKMKPRFICGRCGKGFDRPEMIEECVGEYWGRPATEWQPVSPCCEAYYYEDDEEEES